MMIAAVVVVVVSPCRAVSYVLAVVSECHHIDSSDGHFVVVAVVVVP